MSDDTVWLFLHKWVLANNGNEYRVYQISGHLHIRLTHYWPRPVTPANATHIERTFTQEMQRDPEHMLRLVQQAARALYETVKRQRVDAA